MFFKAFKRLFFVALISCHIMPAAASNILSCRVEKTYFFRNGEIEPVVPVVPEFQNGIFILDMTKQEVIGSLRHCASCSWKMRNIGGNGNNWVWISENDGHPFYTIRYSSADALFVVTNTALGDSDVGHCR